MKLFIAKLSLRLSVFNVRKKPKSAHRTSFSLCGGMGRVEFVVFISFFVLFSSSWDTHQVLITHIKWFHFLSMEQYILFWVSFEVGSFETINFFFYEFTFWQAFFLCKLLKSNDVRQSFLLFLSSLSSQNWLVSGAKSPENFFFFLLKLQKIEIRFPFFISSLKQWSMALFATNPA